VLEIMLPPLREHAEDIPVLVNYLLEKINTDLHRSVRRVPDEVMRRLIKHSWPGNVRELENVLTQAVLTSPADTLSLAGIQPAPTPGAEDLPLKSLADLEKEHIARVLTAVDGNLGRACDVLGITRPTLRKKMDDYGITP